MKLLTRKWLDSHGHSEASGARCTTCLKDYHIDSIVVIEDPTGGGFRSFLCQLCIEKSLELLTETQK